MNRFRLKDVVSPEGIEALVYIAVGATGVTGVGFTLFIGKVYASVLIAVLCFGICIRFKRGRVNKVKK